MALSARIILTSAVIITHLAAVILEYRLPLENKAPLWNFKNRGLFRAVAMMINFILFIVSGLMLKSEIAFGDKYFFAIIISAFAVLFSMAYFPDRMNLKTKFPKYRDEHMEEYREFESNCRRADEIWSPFFGMFISTVVTMLPLVILWA